MNFFLEWNEAKNIRLKKERGIGFDDVKDSIENEKLITIVKNPSQHHQHQLCFVIEVKNYAYLVPFVKIESGAFLKTIYPSRKYTKLYLNRKSYETD